MKKLVILSIALAYLFGTAGSVLAQSAILIATVRVNPLEVEVIAPKSVMVGEWFEIKANISNMGGEIITKVYATIHTDPKLTVGGKRKRVGNLGAGQVETITWLAKARSSGVFVIYVQATGELAGEEISASDTLIVSATSSLGAFLLKLIFSS